MNLQEIYNSFGVRIASQSDRHYRNGWINTSCPYCKGNPGNHLGYNIEQNYFKCWRCGFHPTIKVLMDLLHMNYHDTKQLIYKHDGKVNQKVSLVKMRKKAFKTPPNLIPIHQSFIHKKYLLQRGFNADILENKYGIQAIPHISKLDNINYKFRIFIPIFYKNKMVSWQTRDITDTSNFRYLSCPQKRELIEHKKILYQTPETDFIIITEGVFDTWKVELAGYPATCCFGIEYKTSQLKQLLQYKKIIIFFDSEPQAQEKASQLHHRLLFAGKNVINITPPNNKDPGSMPPEQIRKILNKLNID